MPRGPRLRHAPEPGSDWSRAHYGAVAIKASFAEGDMQQAKQVLALALALIVTVMVVGPAGLFSHPNVKRV